LWQRKGGEPDRRNVNEISYGRPPHFFAEGADGTDTPQRRPGFRIVGTKASAT
jgi:hypothetical protein